MLKEEKEKKRFLFLVQEIKKHDSAYHAYDVPEISDATYDALKTEYLNTLKHYPHFLNLYEHKHSNTDDTYRVNSVGCNPLKTFQKIYRNKAMLSLENIFSNNDIVQFLNRIKKYLHKKTICILAEPKIDGLSLSILYTKGVLSLASTRGNGTEGENVTHAIKMVENVPKELHGKDIPTQLEVRGEVYMTKKNFILLNEYQKQNNKKIFANPRNAAAGSIRQLESTNIEKRPLKFLAYGYGEISARSWKTQKEMLSLFAHWGLPVSCLTQSCHNQEEMQNFYDKIFKERSKIPYDIDGIVYKVDAIQDQDFLGERSRSPRWAVAHKFPAKNAVTRINNIFVQVGRTGALTPVADLEPINIGGVLVARATLHNEEEIKRKNIAKGDLVLVQRAGDVIPQIISVLEKNDNKTLFKFPTKCPSCGSLITHENNKKKKKTIQRCTNQLACPAQALGLIAHFVSRNAFDVEGLGKKNLNFFFYEKKWIKRPDDIFFLQEKDSRRYEKEKLYTQKGWGIASAEDLFKHIENCKEISLNKFIFALGIRHIGLRTAKIIAIHYQNFKTFEEQVISKQKENLESIEGVGEEMAISFKRYFECRENIHMIQNIIESGLIVRPNNTKKEQTFNPTNEFYKRSIVFTGVLECMKRAEAEKRMQNAGSIVDKYVSQKTDFLIVGQTKKNTDSSKIKKAKELSIPILNESEWLQKMEKTVRYVNEKFIRSIQ